MLRKRTIGILIILFITVQCQKESNPFLIEKGKVGKLLKETTVRELDSVYASDSIVKTSGEGDYLYASKDRYLIYEKGGKHLLTLTPVRPHDSTATIANIRIIDPRYKTKEGISINSDFKAINTLYAISKITATLTNVLVFVDEIDAYFTIDRKALPVALQRPGVTPEAEQIPDDTPVKYFMIGWE